MTDTALSTDGHCCQPGNQRDTWVRRMHAWYGLKPADGGRRCPRRLLGKRCVSHRSFAFYPNAPREKCLCIRLGVWGATGGLMDHTRMWRDEQGQLVFTTEPYDAAPERIEELTAEMAELGIKVTVGDRSPWFPGRTTLLMLRRAA